MEKLQDPRLTVPGTIEFGGVNRNHLSHQLSTGSRQRIRQINPEV